ncbi:MAG: hypothetical protein SFW36_15505 [Leptolyngbyaceae cyanobacterium bins.59]|nr:hypothetical protein [Leptolyngbyaceae cyanobacterium bins.59]
MLFQFPTAIQIGLATGKLVQVYSKNGVPLSLVRDAVTGRFAGQAVGVIGLDPLTTVPRLLLESWNVYQQNRTLQAVNALAQSVNILQATTAVIGVGVAASAVLSAVSLSQILKLRKEMADLRLEVKDGFIDLKQALRDQGLEIIEHINRVAEDVEFRHHRTILAQAYGLFRQAIARLQSALAVQDLSQRNAEINSARDMMFKALADYDNPQLLNDTNAAAYIRRRECVWAIHQAIALTYQLQGEPASASHQIQALCSIIRHDSLIAVNQISSQAELDFLFPEVVRIHDHDLQSLNLWQAQIDWAQTLPPDELKLLSSSELNPVDLEVSEPEPLLEEIPEQALYKELQLKSNNVTLCDQLRLMMDPDMRLEYVSVISQQANNNGLKALTMDNLKVASDYTLANLHHYFENEERVLR